MASEHSSDWRARASATIAAASMVACAASAAAADLPLKTPLRAAYDWTGLYIGGHFGFGAGGLGPEAKPLLGESILLPPSVTGFVGGYQVGYSHQFGRLVFGGEADAAFGSPRDQRRPIPQPYNTQVDYVATVRGRAGYAYGPWLPYVTAGAAFGQTALSLTDGDLTRRRAHAGWTAGAGIEAAIGGNWTGKIEYLYVDLSRRTYGLSDVGLPDVAVTPNLHVIRAGLNYRLWDGPYAASRAVLPEASDWSIHGQTTLIEQAYPRIRSPYAGIYSLPAGGQGRETFTTTAFLGWKLWPGTEIFFNPELAQGFGLNATAGLAGFPNGEAQKGGQEFPKVRAQRYVLRQTFGLGGEQEDVADVANQFAGKRDIDRVTLTVGRFAVGDFFDGNAYAKDPRIDFMNWALWASAAYDFPADLPGFTRGAVVELNRKDWALRAGVFQVPSAPNSDVLTFNQGGVAAEFEGRYALAEQPGKIRVGIFGNRGNTGNYRQALASVAIDPALDINSVITSQRRVRDKYGFYLNTEQQLMPDVGVFARYSWNDGRNEILSFTDVDRSVSGGVSIKGRSWGRSDDTIGIGGAVNGLSSAHRDFLAVGGAGLFIGDGRLNYANERILEAYYAYALGKGFTLTADYQFVANPAYNADRGPVSIFGARLHGEF